MKKKLAVLLSMTMAVCTLSACAVPVATAPAAAPAAETKTEEAAPAAESTEGRTFTVGFDADFPPYGYQDENGDYVGFDLDLATEVCARNGWEVVYQPIQWDAKDMELSSGTIDCIWNGFTMSEDRLDTYEWTEPYVDNSQVIVVAKDSGIATYDDLAGKIVCTQADSSALEALNSEDMASLLASFAELTVVPDYNTAFMNMEAGAVDAVALDIGVANYQISVRDDAFVILDQELVTEQYGVGFLKGNTELRDQVQATLNDMAADGKFMEIAEKWGLQDAVTMGK